MRYDFVVRLPAPAGAQHYYSLLDVRRLASIELVTVNHNVQWLIRTTTGETIFTTPDGKGAIDDKFSYLYENYRDEHFILVQVTPALDSEGFAPLPRFISLEAVYLATFGENDALLYVEGLDEPVVVPTYLANQAMQ